MTPVSRKRTPAAQDAASTDNIPTLKQKIAIAAARMIKFVPAMKGGRPVSTYMQLEYNFNLY